MINKPALLSSIAAAALMVFAATGGTHAAMASSEKAEKSEAAPKGLTAAQKAADDKMGTGAQAFVGNMGQQALDFLRDRTMNMEKKKDQFRTLLQSSFDMETIGRFTLGTKWREATPAQQAEFQKLFREMVVGVYSARFQDYKGQKFETRSHNTIDDKDTMVTSYIMPPNEPEVQVDWRVRYKNGTYKIVDVLVEGVSMSVTQRSDFASVIQRGGGGVDVLIEQLRQQAAGNVAPAAK